MGYSFASDFRVQLAESCKTFPRLPYEGTELKRSAVALALTEADDGSGETAFLLTRRAPTLRAHSGQWALPGGRCDPGETPEATALRELHEELGLHTPSESVLGVLDDYVTRSGYAMTPVVCWLDTIADLQPNPAEVASVHRIRLDLVGREDAVEYLQIPESDRPVIRLHIGDSYVHAPTAALIFQLRELAAGHVVRIDHLEQPVFAWR
jgi:8-oxo-dGTP pyrophosphatase MutT (NUDIX family)